MKELYTSIDRILINDAELRNLVGYKQRKEIPIGKEGLQTGVSEMTIRRGYQTEGNWSKLLVYYFQQDVMLQDFCSGIRDLPLVVAIFDRTSDLNLFDIQERVVSLLDGADLTVKGEVFCYDVAYLGSIQSPFYDTDLKSYRMSIRFSIKARKEN